jgi:hypothetical protein
MQQLDRPQKITFAEMRSSGVRGLLIYCADYRCSHHIAISGDRWPDDVRLSDLEPKFTCSACGKRGADVRPDFDWNKATGPTGWAIVEVGQMSHHVLSVVR